MRMRIEVEDTDTPRGRQRGGGGRCARVGSYVPYLLERFPIFHVNQNGSIKDGQIIKKNRFLHIDQITT